VLQLGVNSAPVKLTSSLSPDIDPTDLVDTQVVRFKARDGLTIPNILWKPHQATPTSKAPALVLVHGGPGGQTTSGYSGMVQYYVNHGYVVLGINNRGSSGYGKSFLAADDRRHGREPLWDCVDAKKYLASLPYVDANRIGIMGGSYGGYMVLAALAFQPDEFDVGVDIFGVSKLAAHARRDSGMVGGAAEGALCRDGRSGRRRENALRGVPGVSHGEDQEAAHRAAGGQ
jgi:dipeptidyl aminopeptidase/acylaminoacyl peptidase